ncbi:hypothetical protein CHS0354_031955 [Potamilus streckersoni]|uniref:Uncharacterized protein n=1 Tax=Potamilus streckersoni TaxID=2493646 RepID=A0AAE0VNA7_9BIVA|nr:hypothetical protein CHS0354_031955 [Potamilus streckersoni]
MLFNTENHEEQKKKIGMGGEKRKGDRKKKPSQLKSRPATQCRSKTETTTKGETYQEKAQASVRKSSDSSKQIDIKR